MTIPCLALAASLTFVAAHADAPAPRRGPSLGFEPNQGQMDPAVRFQTRTRDTRVQFTAGAATFLSRGAAPLTLRFAGASKDARVLFQEQSGHVSYFLGADPAGWRAGIPVYARVRVEGVYPGIDVLWTGRDGSLEYDFALAPGADPARIRIAVEGGSATVREDGALVIEGEDATIVQPPPEVFEVGEDRRAVPARFVADGPATFRFDVGWHDPRLPLVIDPVVEASSYLGGSAFDELLAMDGPPDPNPATEVVLVGRTFSTDFPTQGALQGSNGGSGDAFVASMKIDAFGNVTVDWSTYIGGSAPEVANAVRVDPATGEIHVAGETLSGTGFPITAGAAQPVHGGSSDAFYTVLSADGQAILYSTYLGGSKTEVARALDLDGAGRAVFGGVTFSSDFPATAGHAYSGTGGGQDLFLARIDKSQSGAASLDFATSGGGSSDDDLLDVRTDPVTGQAYGLVKTSSADFPVTISYATTATNVADIVVPVLSGDGSSVVYAARVGGSGEEAPVGDAALDADASGLVWLALGTTSTDAPVTQGALQPAHAGGGSDMLLVRLDTKDPTPSGLLVSTYLGGSGADRAHAVRGTADGGAWVGGATVSSDIPIAAPVQDQLSAGGRDAYLARIGPGGSGILFGTWWGGPGGNDGFVALAAQGERVLAAGSTDSPQLPVTPGAFQSTPQGSRDGFLVKISSACDPSEVLGTGKAGSGGITPSLAWNPVAPHVGEPGEILAAGALGQASGFLIAGTSSAQPTSAGSVQLFLDVNKPLVFLPVVTSGPPGVPGAGGLDLDVVIPVELAGFDLGLQLVIQDPGAAFGLASTPGLAVIPCHNG